MENLPLPIIGPCSNSDLAGITKGPISQPMDIPKKKNKKKKKKTLKPVELKRTDEILAYDLTHTVGNHVNTYKEYLTTDYSFFELKILSAMVKVEEINDRISKFGPRLYDNSAYETQKADKYIIGQNANPYMINKLLDELNKKLMDLEKYTQYLPK